MLNELATGLALTRLPAVFIFIACLVLFITVTLPRALFSLLVPRVAGLFSTSPSNGAFLLFPCCLSLDYQPEPGNLSVYNLISSPRLARQGALPIPFVHLCPDCICKFAPSPHCFLTKDHLFPSEAVVTSSQSLWNDRHENCLL